MEALK